MNARVGISLAFAVLMLAALAAFAAGPGKHGKVTSLPAHTVASPALPAITDNAGLAKAEAELNKTNPGSLQGDVDQSQRDAASL